MDSLLTGAACDFCDLSEEPTMFFSTLQAMKWMMKCCALFQDQLHFQPDGRWTASLDFMGRSIPSPRDGEGSIASRSLAAGEERGGVTVIPPGD